MANVGWGRFRSRHGSRLGSWGPVLEDGTFGAWSLEGTPGSAPVFKTQDHGQQYQRAARRAFWITVSELRSDFIAASVRIDRGMRHGIISMIISRRRMQSEVLEVNTRGLI